jgi:hypothetical protein
VLSSHEAGGGSWDGKKGRGDRGTGDKKISQKFEVLLEHLNVEKIGRSKRGLNWRRREGGSRRKK